jgi:hypothetical protein
MKTTGIMVRWWNVGYDMYKSYTKTTLQKRTMFVTLDLSQDDSTEERLVIKTGVSST